MVPYKRPKQCLNSDIVSNATLNSLKSFLCVSFYLFINPTFLAFSMHIKYGGGLTNTQVVRMCPFSPGHRWECFLIEPFIGSMKDDSFLIKSSPKLSNLKRQRERQSNREINGGRQNEN